MNQNTMLIALLIGALFFLRRPTGGQQRPVQGQMEGFLGSRSEPASVVPGGNFSNEYWMMEL
jgi:hypothetical protein